MLLFFWRNFLNWMCVNFCWFVLVFDKKIWCVKVMIWICKIWENRKNFLVFLWIWFKFFKLSFGFLRFFLMFFMVFLIIVFYGLLILWCVLMFVKMFFVFFICWRIIKWFLNVNLKILLWFLCGRLKGFYFYGMDWIKVRFVWLNFFLCFILYFWVVLMFFVKWMVVLLIFILSCFICVFMFLRFFSVFLIIFL